MASSSGPRIRELALTLNLKNHSSLKGNSVLRERAFLDKITKLERVLGIKAGNNLFSTEPLIDPKSIPLSKQLITQHPLARLIKKERPLESREIRLLLEKLNLGIYCYASGSIPAAFNPASDYSHHAWTRDAAIVAHALRVTTHSQESERAMANLACFYARREQRDRFIGFHYSSDPFMKYRFGNPNAELPHIRARIDQEGSMIESDQHWSHSQLDAIGMWLLVTFEMANCGHIDLHKLDHHICANINSDNKVDSIFSVALRFLNRIKYWEQYDHGPWEDKLEPSRASSVGICLGAMKEAEKFFKKFGWTAFAIYQPENLMLEIENSVKWGTLFFEKRVPKTGAYAIETERYPVDSALAFLLYPFNPGLTSLQEKAILKALYSERMGEVGFTRRAEDEYVGMDYPYNKESGVFCNIHQEGYRAAEWTLFDPLLSAYYYQRYLDSSAMDDYSYHLADRHLKRTLAQVTKKADSFSKAYDGQVINIQAGRLPEAFWYDTQKGMWRANENTPLLMAEAAAAIMIERAMEAAKLWEFAKRPKRTLKLVKKKSKGKS